MNGCPAGAPSWAFLACVAVGVAATAILTAAGLLWAERPHRGRADRLESERLAAVAEQADAWRAAHPDLAARGVPPPPTPESVSRWARWT